MKFQFGKLLDNKTFLKIISVILAMISWLVVVKTIDKTAFKTFEGIAVNTAANQAELLTPIGLNIVESAQQKVTVRVTGDRSVLGGLRPEDITVSADLTDANITSPGVYESVKLTGSDINKKGFKISEISPDTVSLRVDRLSTKKFTLTADIEGRKIPEGYLGSETIISPQEIEITGPDADVQRISKCVVAANFEEPLTKTTTVRSDIVLYDSEGIELNADLLTLSSKTADLTIPVNKQKRVPVTYDFLEVPDGFPIHNLEDKLSQGYIDMAGPESLIDSYDVYNLGYVNVPEITQDKVFIFTISLPSGFVNVGNVNTISLQFELADLVPATYTIPGENIVLKNIPANYTVQVMSPSISDVKMLGEADIMKSLTPQEIIAEVDLFGQDLSVGSFSMPVQISAPNKGLVWATETEKTGKYMVVVSIKEKE